MKAKEFELIWPMIKEKFVDIILISGYKHEQVYVENKKDEFILTGKDEMIHIRYIKTIKI